MNADPLTAWFVVVVLNTMLIGVVAKRIGLHAPYWIVLSLGIGVFAWLPLWWWYVRGDQEAPTRG